MGFLQSPRVVVLSHLSSLSLGGPAGTCCKQSWFEPLITCPTREKRDTPRLLTDHGFVVDLVSAKTDESHDTDSKLLLSFCLGTVQLCKASRPESQCANDLDSCNYMKTMR